MNFENAFGWAGAGITAAAGATGCASVELVVEKEPATPPGAAKKIEELIQEAADAAILNKDAEVNDETRKKVFEAFQAFAKGAPARGGKIARVHQYDGDDFVTVFFTYKNLRVHFTCNKHSKFVQVEWNNRPPDFINSEEDLRKHIEYFWKVVDEAERESQKWEKMQEEAENELRRRQMA